MSWDEEVSAAEAANKTVEPVQPKPKAGKYIYIFSHPLSSEHILGSSAPVLNGRTISQSTSTFLNPNVRPN